MKLVWVRNSATGATVQQPESAVPILAQSGWAVMSPEEVTELEQSFTRGAAEAEKAMAEAAKPTPPPAPQLKPEPKPEPKPDPEPEPGPAPAPRKSGNKENS